MADVDLMPPAVTGIDPGAETEEERRNRVGRIVSMPPAAVTRPVQPSSQPASPSAMPPVSSPQPSRPLPSASPSGMPPVPPSATATALPPEEGKAAMGATPPTATAMPPAGRAPMSEVTPIGGSSAMPPVTAGPAQQRLDQLNAQGPPQPKWWQRALQIAGSIHPLGRLIESQIPGTPLGYNTALNQAAIRAAREQGAAGTQAEQGRAAAGEARTAKAAQENSREGRQAFLDQNTDVELTPFEKADFLATGKMPQKEPTPPKQENLQQDYAAAVEDAQKAGRDPASDPKVQQIADAITSLQKQPAAPKDMTAKAGTLNGKPAWAIQTDQGWIDPETRKPVHGFQPQQPAGIASPTDIGDLAHGVMSGQLPPDLKEYGFRDRSAIAAELKRQGFDLTKATQDWTATQKYLATLNGSQQTRLRQAVESTKGYLGQVEDIYNQWQKVAPTSDWKAFNKASLATAKQLPGESGDLAHRLEARIADLTSDLGTVYKGGNSSTDESLKLAAKNLEGDWNEKTFKDAIADIRKSIVIRENSLKLPTAGTNAGTYTPNSEQKPKPPEKGDAVDGYTFNGGDPSDKKNWTKQ